MKTLQDTIEMMNSSSYKDRMIAEYEQVTIRYNALYTMVSKWDAGTLEFTPTCARSTYDIQLRIMEEYIAILEVRATMEEIDLSNAVKPIG